MAQTITAASANVGDIIAALANAVDGDTILVPAGNVTWTTPLDVNKSVRIIGAGQGQTNVTDNLPRAPVPNHVIGVTLTKERSDITFQLSGFSFSTQSGVTVKSTYFLYITGKSAASDPVKTVLGCVGKVRIDHIDFVDLRSGTYITSDSILGVVDHCKMISTLAVASGGTHYPIYTTHGNWTPATKPGGNTATVLTAALGGWAEDAFWGSEKFLFFEDCYFGNGTGVGSATFNNICDSVDGARYVFRHCTFDNSTSLASHGWETHPGTRCVENYNNEYIMTTASGLAELRSGNTLFYNNLLTNYPSSTQLPFITFRIQAPNLNFGQGDGSNRLDSNVDPDNPTHVWTGLQVDPIGHFGSGTIANVTNDVNGHAKSLVLNTPNCIQDILSDQGTNPGYAYCIQNLNPTQAQTFAQGKDPATIDPGYQYRGNMIDTVDSGTNTVFIEDGYQAGPADYSPHPWLANDPYRIYRMFSSIGQMGTGRTALMTNSPAAGGGAGAYYNLFLYGTSSPKLDDPCGKALKALSPPLGGISSAHREPSYSWNNSTNVNGTGPYIKIAQTTGPHCAINDTTSLAVPNKDIYNLGAVGALTTIQVGCSQTFASKNYQGCATANFPVIQSVPGTFSQYVPYTYPHPLAGGAAPAPAIIGPNTAQFTATQSNTFSGLSTANFTSPGTVTWDLFPASPGWPSGVTMDVNTGVISGTPASGTETTNGGQWPVTTRARTTTPPESATRAFTLIVVAPAVNRPPTVTGISTDSVNYFAPATVTITATATDPDPGDSITKMEFFRGGTFSIGTVTTFPFTFVWTSVPVGSYSITAKATDNHNNTSAASTAVNISVLAQPLSLPPPTIVVSATMTSTVVNLLTEGATGNGTTDDQTAITNALAKAKSLGLPLYAPGGHTYKHSNYITIDGVSVYGDGDTTVFSASNVNAGALRLTGTNPSLKSVKTIYNPAPTTRLSTGPQSGVFIDHATGGYTVDNVTVANSPCMGILSYSGLGTSGSHAKVNNCRVSNTLADAIHMTNGSAYVDITSCTVTNPGDDMFAVVSYLGDGVQTHDILYDGNTGVWNAGTPNDSSRGMSVVGGNHITFNNNTVTNTQFAGVYLASESAAADGFDCFSVDTVTVQNCHIDKAAHDFPASGHAGIMTYGHASGHTVANITLSGNTITNSANHGIDCRTFGSNISVSGNTITRTGDATNINQPGINVDSASTIISNNTISDTGGEGVRILSTATATASILTNDFSKISRVGTQDVINIQAGAVVTPLTITNNTYHTDPAGWQAGTFVNLHGYVGATVSGNNQVP